MVALNTRQRDMLCYLIKTEGSITINELAEQMGLTPRQVNYGLKGVRLWLEQRNIYLFISPGVGIELQCTPATRQELLTALISSEGIDLVLTSGQRRQLIAFTLLTEIQPIHLARLQSENNVSRSTILKDIDDVEGWLQPLSLTIERRPNYGIWVDGAEMQKRQALTILFWGGTPFEDQLWSISHQNGLEFELSSDTQLLPILQEVVNYQERLNLANGLSQVAFAEADMGGRFTDREVLHLALALAVQFERLDRGIALDQRPLDFQAITRLSSGMVWKVSEHLLQNRIPDAVTQDSDVMQWETALVVMRLLAGTKNDRWPGDSETEKEFEHLIAILLKRISEAYEMSALMYDTTLRDGLVTNLIPACLRSIFGLWAPPLKLTNLLDEGKYLFEYELARDVSSMVADRTGVDCRMLKSAIWP